MTKRQIEICRELDLNPSAVRFVGSQRIQVRCGSKRLSYRFYRVASGALKLEDYTGSIRLPHHKIDDEMEMENLPANSNGIANHDSVELERLPVALGWLAMQPNPRLAAVAMMFVVGAPWLMGETMSTAAQKLGVTKAAVSKVANNFRRAWGLKRSSLMKDSAPCSPQTKEVAFNLPGYSISYKHWRNRWLHLVLADPKKSAALAAYLDQHVCDHAAALLVSRNGVALAHTKPIPTCAPVSGAT